MMPSAASRPSPRASARNDADKQEPVTEDRQEERVDVLGQDVAAVRA